MPASSIRATLVVAMASTCAAFHLPGAMPRASLGLSRTLAMTSRKSHSPLGLFPEAQSRGFPLVAQRENLKPLQASSAGGLELKGETSMPGMIANLMKNIVGSGVLCVAGGVAAATDQKAALIPAVLIAFAFAAIAGYCFTLVGRVSLMTGANSYTQGWAKTVGESTAWIPNLIVVFKTWSACLIYSMIIGDLFTDLAVTAGISTFAGIGVNRVSILIASHLFGLLPLCLLRSFSALSFASVLGIGGLLFTGVFMVMRMLDGSYLPGGKFYSALMTSGGAGTIVSSFDVMGTSPIKSLILISMLTNSYLCHYNAPKFMRELKDASISRFNQMTGAAFFGAFGLNAVYMIAGFLTFGGAAQGLILNNFATSDALATIARGAIAFSILFGYPLTFEGFRTSALEFAKVNAPTQRRKDAIAIGFIASVCMGAIVLSDLGVVVAFLGALLGSFVIYVFPSLMYRKAREIEVATTKEELGIDHTIAGALIGGGVGLGLLGAAVVFLKATTKILG
mmetsp:Transcript_20269/g.47048  ORF Transcript_20269/g.47048 Transcript_20269/m.47048 type:complete len:509 (-) Transcript_20269:82-1608(-)